MPTEDNAADPATQDAYREREIITRELGYPPTIDPCVMRAINRVIELSKAQARSHDDYYGVFPPCSDERDKLVHAFETAIFEDYAPETSEGGGS